MQIHFSHFNNVLSEEKDFQETSGKKKITDVLAFFVMNSDNF